MKCNSRRKAIMQRDYSERKAIRVCVSGFIVGGWLPPPDFKIKRPARRLAF
jgi:hypothetical protein